MKKYLLLSLIFFISFSIFSQKKETLIIIESENVKKEISKSEFERIYKKNNDKDKIEDVKTLEEYLELFINFKLKVTEAEEMYLDTLSKFKKELAGYRRQLSKPYLSDKNLDEKLLKEAYEHMKYDVNASHILIKIDEMADYKDTLKAYKKLMKIRKRVLKGEDFAKLARIISEDPSAKKNGGNLGFFTAFQMIYDFEKVAYNLSENEVSYPVRTKFGYHLIKLHKKKKARGKVKVAHIMLGLKSKATKKEIDSTKALVFDIHSRLKKGGDFSKLAEKYSNDKGSAKKGGELQFFGVGRMVKEFEDAAFSLKKDGDISEPIETNFGWHIIKRIKKKNIEEYEVLKPELKRKVSRDIRATKSRKFILKKLKKEYSFKFDEKKLKEFNEVLDTSIFNGDWKIDKAEKLDGNLFSFADKNFSQKDFSKFLFETQSKNLKKIPVSIFIDKKFKIFTDKKVIEYEEANLENKYDEFKYLMKEYHDGMLLFDLTDKKIWTKASKDTVGLKKYYSDNKENFLSEEKVEINIYSCLNEKVLQKTLKLLSKKSKKNFSTEDILYKINKKNKENLKIEEKVYKRGDDNFLDKMKWKDNFFQKKDDKTIIEVKKFIPEKPKKFAEVKGTVTANYQNFLEKKWITDLREKYKITINKSLLSKIKN